MPNPLFLDVSTSDSPFVRAAVLVPIFEHDGATCVVYLERAADVPVHRSQMAFPGGVHRASDGTLLATALREGQEEIGLLPDHVEVVQAMPEVRTFTSNFLIAPFLVKIPDDYSFAPDPREVARIAVVRLDALRAPGAFRRVEERLHSGEVAMVDAYAVGDDVIWGATERITTELLRLL
jgi:8-oxo-dGTP pyrophosphatase MutT (NUDIX family)